MSFQRNLAFLAVGALLLAACATASIAPVGAYKVGASEVQLGRAWSDITSWHGAMPKGVKALSVDGPLLNRLYIIDGLPEGKELFKPARKETPTPVVRPDMSANERMEFVADSIAVLGYQDVEASAPRPGKYGDIDGVRFELSGRSPEGLDMKGIGVAASRDDRLYLFIYYAPAEHYYGALLPEVERVLTSLRVGAA